MVKRPETAFTLAAENEELRRQLKEYDKEIKRLNVTVLTKIILIMLLSVVRTHKKIQ